MTYHPYRELRARPEISLGSCVLPEGQAARWYPECRTILLGAHLNQSGRRSALAHELAHIELGHQGSECARATARQERAADDLAARRLVSLDDLVDALLWSQDEHELAEWLWVDVETIRARLVNLSSAEHDYINRRVWEREESA